jgi:hypothetical protein
LKTFFCFQLHKANPSVFFAFSGMDDQNSGLYGDVLEDFAQWNVMFIPLKNQKSVWLKYRKHSLNPVSISTRQVLLY